MAHIFFMAPYMWQTAERWITVSAKGFDFFLLSFPKAFHGHKVPVLTNLLCWRFKKKNLLRLLKCDNKSCNFWMLSVQ